MDFPFWNILISNAVMASLLAAAAIFVRKTVARPQLEHFVWLLVLIKLFTPPICDIHIPWPSAAVPQVQLQEVTDAPAMASAATMPVSEASVELSFPEWLLLAWVLGSALLCAIYLVRSYRFGRLLALAQPADAKFQDKARQIAIQLGVSRLPRIRTTAAAISPLVCWQRGRLLILLPSQLLATLSDEARRAILAHELAHIKRRDHLVRLLETCAMVCFWWHPATWIARKNLQECGELCCDAHVLACTTSAPRTYANALMQTMDWLSDRGARVTWSATAATGNFRSLTRRFQMLTHTNRTSRVAAILSLSLAVMLTGSMGLGVAWGQDGGKGKASPPPARKLPAGTKLWTMEFKITEADASGKETVLCSPTIRTPSDASVKIEGEDRKIEVFAKPIKDTKPQQWQVEFKLKEKGNVLASPKLIVIDEGTAEMETTLGETGNVRRLKFAFNVKR